MNGRVLAAAAVFLAAWCILPAAADQLEPTVTRVFFEKDGSPYHGSVQFTVNCYGYRCSRYDCSRAVELGETATPLKEKVFSFSATCPEYGCTIYEPFYLNYRQIERCDIEGTSPEGAFAIPNFSGTPVPDCTDLVQYNIGGKSGIRGYYNGTAPYDRCREDARRERGKCDRFLVECDPAKDDDCGYRVLNGRRVKESPAYHDCREEMNRKQEACDAFLEEVDLSSMVLWKDPWSGRQEPAMRSCELRFAIPSGTMMPEDTPPAREPAPAWRSPVESLYCSILQFFGGSC